MLEKYNDCSIDWDGEPLKILVYNKNFRESNFGKGEISGVFTLGKASKDVIENLNNKKNELSIIIDINSKIETKNKLEKDIEDGKKFLKELCWSQIKQAYENV